MSEEDYRQDGSLILIHEKKHLSYYHTLDLGWMHCLLIFHWFNPMTWVLWQELRDLHEYEADEGVISSGVNMVQYQLLLVKKAVGTRLYSMANGFDHSKLKNRIGMMLKKRSNGWARAWVTSAMMPTRSLPATVMTARIVGIPLFLFAALATAARNR